MAFVILGERYFCWRSSDNIAAVVEDCGDCIFLMDVLNSD